MAEPDKDLTERELDALFAAGRAHATAPSEALMARILAEAEAVMPSPPAADVPARPRAAGGLVRGALSALGGWGTVGGLATAAATGVWIGLTGVADPVAAAGGLLEMSELTVELMPGAGGTGWE